MHRNYLGNEFTETAESRRLDSHLVTLVTMDFSPLIIKEIRY